MHSNVMVRTLQKRRWVDHFGKKQEACLIHSATTLKNWILNHLAAVDTVAISSVFLYARYVSFHPELMGNSGREMEEVKKTDFYSFRVDT